MSGRRLLIMADDDWRMVGVASMGLRLSIMRATVLLVRAVSCLFDVETTQVSMQIDGTECDTAQTLALQTSVSAKDLLNSLNNTTPRSLERLNSLFSFIAVILFTLLHCFSSSNLTTTAMISLCASIADVVAAARRLVAWLDAPPLVATYAPTRDTLLDLTKKLLRATQVPVADMLRQQGSRQAIRIVR